MSGKLLKDKLIKGDRVFGTFFQHAICPAVVDFLPPGALDFVIVTAEHNALDIADFLPVKYALNAKGIACLARTHSRDPDDVSKVCDSYDGVVVPYVEEVAHAKALAAAAVYRPLKGRALQKAIDKNEWPSQKTKDYIANVRCADTVFIPMIESLAGIDNLDAICSIPGVHAVFVGPNDLAASMRDATGRPPAPDVFKQALADILAAAKRIGVPAGIHTFSIEEAKARIAEGWQFIAVNSELKFMSDGAKAVVDGLGLGKGGALAKY